MKLLREIELKRLNEDGCTSMAADGVDDDNCDSNCTVTGCGNQIITSGE